MCISDKAAEEKKRFGRSLTSCITDCFYLIDFTLILWFDVINSGACLIISNSAQALNDRMLSLDSPCLFICLFIHSSTQWTWIMKTQGESAYLFLLVTLWGENSIYWLTDCRDDDWSNTFITVTLDCNTTPMFLSYSLIVLMLFWHSVHSYSRVTG